MGNCDFVCCLRMEQIAGFVESKNALRSRRSKRAMISSSSSSYDDEEEDESLGLACCPKIQSFGWLVCGSQ